MDGPGFHVEPDVLDLAARGMADTVAAQDGSGLDTLAGPPERYGHDGVHAALTEFGDAWTIGVDALCDRSRWMGRSLREVARAYRDADARTAEAFGDAGFGDAGFGDAGFGDAGLRGDPAMTAADPPAVPDR